MGDFTSKVQLQTVRIAKSSGIHSINAVCFFLGLPKPTLTPSVSLSYATHSRLIFKKGIEHQLLDSLNFKSGKA